MTEKRGKPLELIDKRAVIIELAKDGWSQRRIGEEVGLSHTAVGKHIKAWVAEMRADSAEATEAYVTLSNVRLDDLIAGLRPKCFEGGEANLPVIDRLLKVMERQARLNGLDAQVDVAVNVLTQEQIGPWLMQHFAQQGVIEGTAVEITDGEEQA